MAPDRHDRSARAGGPFVPVNCASVSPDLIESELFGHAKGAFTGAARARDGLFHYAQGGTLFLDEVAELPLSIQATLLRAIEDLKIRPVGSEQLVPLNLRVVAATNRQLQDEVAAGRFRKDLYFRLQVMDLALPPLRDHKDDIPELVAHFNALLAPTLGVDPLQVSPEEMAFLQQYDWPGNVRELRNLIERSLILGSLNVSALYPGQPPASPRQVTDLHTLEKLHIQTVLDSVQGDKTRAAELLGVARRSLERAARADRMVRGAKAKLTLDRVGYMTHPDWVVSEGAQPPHALGEGRVYNPFAVNCAVPGRTMISTPTPVAR